MSKTDDVTDLAEGDLRHSLSIIEDGLLRPWKKQFTSQQCSIESNPHVDVVQSS
ncbi:MAG: hypothetical protein IPL22_00310 [Bacteroidetes bacterium]|nr:hypothetical protein [Bacteroidota bacterium]